MKKNYVVKSDFVYGGECWGVGLHWTFEQKRATRYTREEAIARKEYLRPACGNLRVVKLVQKNHIVKSADRYDVLGSPRWTFEQKRATRYTREEAIARKEYLRPSYGKVRAVKLVPKKAQP